MTTKYDIGERVWIGLVPNYKCYDNPPVLFTTCYWDISSAYAKQVKIDKIIITENETQYVTNQIGYNIRHEFDRYGIQCKYQITFTNDDIFTTEGNFNAAKKYLIDEEKTPCNIIERCRYHSHSHYRCCCCKCK